MIGFIKERLLGSKNKPTRAQVLAARPLRNPGVVWEREKRNEDQPSVVVLQIPRRHDRIANLAARLLKLPEYRKVELDEIGSDVWEMCDGDTSVDALTRAVCTKYRLNRRQAETSVTAYLRQLAERRLIALRTGAGGATAKKKQITSRRQKRA